MIINCKECGREISDTAKQCPHCGAKVKKEKAKSEKSLALQKLSEIMRNNKKLKLGFIASLIGSCAVAICFLIMTMVAYCLPRAFLNSRICSDAFELCIDKANEPSYSVHYSYDVSVENQKLRFTFVGRSRLSTFGVDISMDNGTRAVEYRFYPDGEVTLEFVAEGVGGDTYWCYYDMEGMSKIYNHASRRLLDVERELADLSIEFVTSAINSVLINHGKGYTFNSILRDYADYHDSLTAIRTSSVVLMSIFTVVSAFGIILCVKCFDRKKETNAPKEE